MSTRPVGLTKDAGWEIGVSRSLPASVEQVWSLLLSPEGLAAWLGAVDRPLTAGAAYRTADGTRGEVRSLREHDRVRLTWQPPGRATDATVQVVVRPGPRGASLRFHSERLASAEEREAMRERWKAALDRLSGLLTAGT